MLKSELGSVINHDDIVPYSLSDVTGYLLHACSRPGYLPVISFTALSYLIRLNAALIDIALFLTIGTQ